MLNPLNVSFKNYVSLPSIMAKPLAPKGLQRLEKDVFEHSAVNISFTSVDNSKVGDAIRALGDVPCPYCGIKVINGKEFAQLQKQDYELPAKNVLGSLKKYEDRMHPVEKQVFNLLENLSKKSPKKTIRQLLDSQRDKHLQNLKSQEYCIFDELTEYSKTFKNKDDAKAICNLVEESREIVNKQDANYIFRRKRLIEKLDNITSNMQEKDKAEEISKIADKIPRGHDNIDAFIVKFTQKDTRTKEQKSSKQIAMALIEPSVGSLEHIKPRHPQDGSEGGKNTFSNYLYASKEWNTRRKNMPLDKWVEKNPQIKENMQKYIDAVIEKINSRKALSNCRVYPIIAAETVAIESKGLIKLDVSKLKISDKEKREGLKEFHKEQKALAKKHISIAA